MIHARFKLGYPNFVLDVDIDLPGYGITALFGPSGSGKTTLLRCIAGLERAQGGLLRVKGEVWQEGARFLPAHQRRVGYVFQEANLFPHLSVRDNLEYGYKRIAPGARNVQMEQVIPLLGLGKLIERRDPSSLSGGERQRVAIGRALLTSPNLLLMDEPLSGLDAASKQEILPYLERLHGEMEIPVFYVSHALDEVARLADRLVLLEQGCAIAHGTLNEMLSRLDLPTAHYDNAGVVIEAQVAVQDETYHLTRLDFPGGSLWVGRVEHAAGTSVRARVLARDVSVATAAPQGSSITNILATRIVEIRDEGQDRVNLRMEVGGGQMLLSRITRRSRDQLGLTVDMELFAQVKSVALIA
ncbi:MAG: Molybdate ABC transporter, ATP-binding protein ModC [Candidatus Gallionella acididurans]|uniref:Molybdate ABC transporter, ATP-binding protein ModC n=1 Tax=Candidatus Gallionella acididurans TaxID=1796491 RepID=A0A139BVI3_9PROT|nr:MAG: Molybdate ABC transporter, ATP-binding protein ModC [Candidatus Gallionella acididurans]